MRIAILVTGLLLASSCTKDAPPPKRQGIEVADPSSAPEIRVHADESHVYRYFPHGESKAKIATSLEEVPASARQAVLVIPDAEMPAGLVYVADLRKARDDGTYSYEVVLTADFDRSMADARPARLAGAIASSTVSSTGSTPASRAPATTADEIIMFSTTWCGVCKQARRWFRNKGLAYTEKDVEKTPGARDEMMRRAKQAGFPSSQLNGVPIIWINGKMLGGFNPRAIQNLLGS